MARMGCLFRSSMSKSAWQAPTPAKTHGLSLCQILQRCEQGVLLEGEAAPCTQHAGTVQSLHLVVGVVAATRSISPGGVLRGAMWLAGATA
jgi:hypothetical protein